MQRIKEINEKFQKERCAMRNLTASEINSGEIGDGMPEEGDIAVEMTLQEAADKKIGTCCGYAGNQCFVAVAALFPDANKRLVRGWYCPENNPLAHINNHNTFGDMVNIQCSESEGEQISEAAGNARGSLRFDSENVRWPGFCYFEVE